MKVYSSLIIFKNNGNKAFGKYIPRRHERLYKHTVHVGTLVCHVVVVWFELITLGTAESLVASAKTTTAIVVVFIQIRDRGEHKIGLYST